MLVIKQCKCGGTNFERDEDGSLRCTECWSRAVREYVKDDEEESET